MSPTQKPWVDPAALPRATSHTLAHPAAARIAGNAPLRAKQLALNTFAAYGVGGADAFGHAAGRQVRFVRIDVHFDRDADADGAGGGAGSSSSGSSSSGGAIGGSADGGADAGADAGAEPDPAPEAARSNATRRGAGTPRAVTAVAELVIDKTMVNGNGMLHGGCTAYLIDNCASVPLVVLGLVRGRNGVGVTQALNILYHAPASRGSTLEIVCTSLALGGRSMTAKCEIFDKSSRRLVASAFINKMEPKL